MPPDDSPQTTAPGPPAAGAPPFWAVVPAGGVGSRLWPLSRSTHPKYLLPLLGDRSLLQATVDRLEPLAGPDRRLVVCGPSHAAAVARQLPELPAHRILVEPAPRGTGPAIGLAAAMIARLDPDAVMGSFAADHDVRDPAAFRRAVRAAIAASGDGWLVALGIAPTGPETGYGYLERTEDLLHADGDHVVYRAARFVEKPDLARATELVAGGRCLWNAGMFVWSVRSFLAELERHQPELAAGLATIADAWGTAAADRVLGEVWPTLPDVSIETGLMERSDRVAVVPVEMGRSDLGDWHGLGRRLQADESGNCGSGDRVLLDSRRTVVWSTTGRLVTVVGLDDLVVVDAGDALLVTRRDASQRVKDIVARLRHDGHHHLT